MEAGLWTEILGHLARKLKGHLRFVDSTFIKVHQAGQGAIGGSKNQAIGLTKGGHNSKLTAAVDERGHVVALLLFPGQCAETTAAKQLLPLLAKIMVFVRDKGFDSDELRQLIEVNGGLACIPPRSNRTSHRWSDPEFYRMRHLVENISSWENLVVHPYGAVEVPEEEEDARAVVLERSKATRGGFDLLDFAVKAFAQGVGQTADAVVE